MTAILDGLTSLFIFVVGLVVLSLIVLFFIDRYQTNDTVRRNYPVIGRMRHILSELGEFFRQYFFAMDREEMPFNRAQRDWVDDASKAKSTNVAFGSTRNLDPVGTPIFVNCPWPTLERDAVKAPPMRIGEGAARTPYDAPSIFNISGMSYGSLSTPAVRALSSGAAKAGCWMNTGEGGLSPYHLEGGCDIVFQIGTAKYGVRDDDGNLSDEKLREVAAHEKVRMFELKLSQGAKPGKGGILPAAKVNAEIAKIRGIPEGEASISPNRHTDIGSIEELLDMIARIREVTGKPVGFKTVIGAYGWLQNLFEEINKRGPQSAPDFITVDSGDGGTGAAPMPLIDNVGLTLREALPMLVDLRDEAGLKDRIRIVASGKLVTPSEVAWAICAGADFTISARGFMFALGCIQAMKCNKNTCPTGITTHDPSLQRGLDPANKSVRVANFVKQMRKEVGVIAHSVGVTNPRGMKRYHVRLVCADGRSRPLDELYPSATKQVA
ncbi:FMN-binding glutamate synthase family protein [Erythrobacter sp. F6033]|uniref:FMN-binding glutamate synthase family protein n=1 Tax=Erythrobacter sp. F6033 TaxID=2926401 RepID=UPI001FF66EED|nr:FMN-binding glutamate synthase family protein [Erythrobacter sp. F6033]MCK0129140.1 FMN-binding glutamate synthase family protein [Erythrobacter sp. F6033]